MNYDNGGRSKSLLRSGLLLLVLAAFVLSFSAAAFAQDNPPKKEEGLVDHYIYAITEGGGPPPAGAQVKDQHLYIFGGWKNKFGYTAIGSSPIHFWSLRKNRAIFKAVAGYTLVQKTLYYSWVGGNYVTTGVYKPDKAAIKVNLTGPAGAKWTWSGTSGTGTVTGSGQVEVLPGGYTVSFSTVTGWNKPASQTFTLAANTTKTINATYTPKPVTVNIAMNPSSVNGGWSWSNNKGESGSGSGAGSFTAKDGNFTVNFSDTSIWKTTTPTHTFSLNPGDSTTRTGQYTAKVSTVNINITSNKGTLVLSHNPSWTLSGTPATGGSFTPVNGSGGSSSVYNVPFGSYVVTFHNTTSGAWTKPGDVNVSVGTGASPAPAVVAINDGPVTPDPVVGSYTEKTASATVNINSTPAGVLSHGPSWNITGTSDNGESVNIGGNGATTTVPALPYGAYSVVYNAATSGAWLTPASVALVARDTVTPNPATGTYVEKTASVTINITGDKGSLVFGHNPSWSMRGTTANGASYGPVTGSGASSVVSSVPYGRYIVSYNGTTSGAWITPGAVKVAVGYVGPRPDGKRTFNGGIVVPNPVIGHYIEKTNDATIKITSDPADGALAHGANWILTGTSANGESVTVNGAGAASEDLNDIPYGTYTVTFKDTTSGAWNTPAADTLTVGRSVSPKPLTGHYTEKVGSLTIAIASDVSTAGTALGDGAAWTMAGTTANGASFNQAGTGASTALADIPWGDYIITFKDIFADLGKPWDVPSAVVLTLNGDMGTYTGQYIRHTGSLIVYIEPPEAVSDGAQWRTYSSTGWRNSGATVTGIPTGNVTVEFANVVGWETPPLVGVTINKDATTTLTTIYLRKPAPVGSLQIFGEDKRLDDIGFWRPEIDGIGLSANKFYKRGEIVHGIPRGDVKIVFKVVPGLVLPDFNSLKVRPGITNQAEANFVRPLIIHKSDYNGDGTEDLAVFDVKSRKWSVASAVSGSGGSPAAKLILEKKFGKKTDIPTPGDYDADGRADLAAYDELKGIWKVLKNKEASITNFGEEGDIPVPGDYTGDGKTQPALFRPSTGEWLIYDYDKEKVIEYTFGKEGDVPVPGNWDGDADGMTDLAVYNVESHEWKVAIWNEKKKKWLPRKKYGGKYGEDGDIPIQADYDGDGKTDIAVYRRDGSLWRVRTQFELEFGEEGDLPVPNDWAGLGRVIPAVFRISSGRWIAVDNLLSAKHGAGGLPLVSGR